MKSFLDMLNENLNVIGNWKIEGSSKQKVDNIVDIVYNGDKHAHIYIAYDDSIEVYSLIAANSISDIEQWISTIITTKDEDMAEKIFNMKYDRIDIGCLRKLNLTSIYRIK